MYRARHARPSALPARTAVLGTVGAALIPLSALPASAQEAGPFKSRLSTLTETPAPAVAPAAARSTPSPAPAPSRTASSMGINAEPADVHGRARIWVSLNSGGSPVAGQPVAVEALGTDGAWRYVGQATTGADGVATTVLPFDRATRVRSTFSGSESAGTATSPEDVVEWMSLGERAVRLAAGHDGKPYRYGSAGPDSFDCSGFTSYVYNRQLGQSLPRTSADQERALPRVAQDEKRVGDLLFFRYGGRVSHVAIYAGDGMMWDAPSSGGRVSKRAIYTSSYTVGRMG